MSRVHWQQQLEIPAALAAQLGQYRRRVWGIKLIEAAALAAVGVLAGFLCVFVLDRLVDTPAWLRMAVAGAAAAISVVVPLYLYRWVWRFRRLDQLARLLGRKLPRVGDQLLGVIELAENRWEQSRSPALCQAAIEQVAADARQRDFRTATPHSRGKTFVATTAVLMAIVALLAACFPAAAGNAWARFWRPWRDTPRYTFALLEPLPEKLIIAHGEPFELRVQLSGDSLWRPATARARLGEQQPVVAALGEGGYRFEFGPQIVSGPLRVRVGDATRLIDVEPTLRPELVSIDARIKLPDYLGQPDARHKDARGGTLAVVKGAQVALKPVANRELASASANGTSYDCRGAAFETEPLVIEDAATVELSWRDELGLSCHEPFTLSIAALDDEPPQLACEDLPRGRVVLDTEQLVFRVRASDDFGVQQIGMAWNGVPSDLVETPAKGRSKLAAGGHDQATMEIQGTFTASSLGIEPQPIELRIFATDYYPGREPVHTAPYLLYVLNKDQHAIWITEQLSRWHRQSLEVRDRELQLYEGNKALRALSPQELDRPDTRRRVASQASAERVNARRLANLTLGGKDLLRQAARNPEIGVGHLEKWAEMLQILEDISANRMPSVADLLKEASQAPRVAMHRSPSRPTVGNVRASGPAGGAPQESKLPQPKSPPIPAVVDVESSQQPGDEDAPSAEPGKKKPSAPTLRLPVTTVMGKASPGKKAADPPAAETVEQAVAEQRDLLAEFEKVANELNTVLANLEGSTLVKRLKAASRQQYEIGGRISDHLTDSFGTLPEGAPRKVQAVLARLARQENDGIGDISYIMDDLAAYFERRRLVPFKAVLDDMRAQDVLGGLRQLADDIPREHGLSIAQCEYWSDTMDRWAEDLVDPACSGACPGCRAKGCLPPSIILEVLQILEAEVNLREETRVAEQARSGFVAAEYEVEANRLADSQNVIEDRVVKVVDRIRALPDGEADFTKEIALLGRVAEVMTDAAHILARPDTGAAAIAAETEAIELLLQSKRINPAGGGGGGANPGGGGTGDTQDAALALLGAGFNQKEVRESQGTEQAVGDSGASLPEEYRAGLNQYFLRLEQEAN